MVRILPLVGAAALLAQTTLGAVVPMRRGYRQEDQPSRQYNQYNYQQQQHNQGNQYNNHENQYQQQNQHEQPQELVHTTTVEAAHEVSPAPVHEPTYVPVVHETTSVAAHELPVETPVHEPSSVVAYENVAHETTTTEHVMPTYGSGSNSWGNNYNDCVSQCMAQFGSPPHAMDIPAAAPTETHVPSGAIHTVMVAPEGAGLRYVPFALNASVGDTVRYVWTTSANHTATLSSALNICNRSGVAEQRNFVSGIRNGASGVQTFDVRVETSEPQFFYCSVAAHCERGMFGIINPASASLTNNVRGMMGDVLRSNPSIEAAYNYMKSNVTQDSPAADWGLNISLDGIPESAYADVVANVLYTQGTMAVNPGMLEGNQGAANPDGSPLKLLPDLNVLLSSAAAVPSSPNGDSTPVVTSDPSTITPVTPANAENGSLSGKGVKGVWVAAVVGIAGWLLI